MLQKIKPKESVLFFFFFLSYTVHLVAFVVQKDYLAKVFIKLKYIKKQKNKTIFILHCGVGRFIWLFQFWRKNIGFFNTVETIWGYQLNWMKRKVKMYMLVFRSTVRLCITNIRSTFQFHSTHFFLRSRRGIWQW